MEKINQIRQLLTELETVVTSETAKPWQELVTEAERLKAYAVELDKKAAAIEAAKQALKAQQDSTS